MRLIKSKERQKAGNIYCSFCRPDKVHTVYRVAYANHANGFACEEHKHLLPKEDDGHMSEADYQTWGRL